MTPLAEAFQELLATLDRLEIAYFAGGSLASSVHGFPRQTNDVHFVAEITRDNARDLCEALHPAFYADLDAALRAVETGRAFNIIHVSGAFKFDLFPVGQDRFARSELARRNIEFPVASAEDTILSKLVGFRKGGEISDRQWHDILGVIQVQADRLDQAYLRTWAANLGVSDLLAKACLKPEHFHDE